MAQIIEAGALHKLSYGLFVLTAQGIDLTDNGCIINTAVQVTESPKRISIAVNKCNYTHDLITASREFNISVLTVGAPFDLFKRFGFVSGRDTDKFDGFRETGRMSNSLIYIKQATNAVISARVIESIDCGTHTLFIADVTEAIVLSDVASATYDYYFSHIKPKPVKVATPAESKKTKYVCSICGYEYEGDELPADFVCPICLHGAEYFGKI